MKLNCVNIVSTKAEEMRGFYALALNTPGSNGPPPAMSLRVDNFCIVITPTDTKTPVSPDCCGLEFGIRDVDAEYRRLTAAGVKTGNQPVTLPWQYRYFAVRDPDVNNIDFVQYVGGEQTEG